MRRGVAFLQKDQMAKKIEKLVFCIDRVTKIFSS